MLKHLRRANDLDDVRFCDRCSTVCDRRCQADALARRTLEQTLRFGWRLA